MLVVLKLLPMTRLSIKQKILTAMTAHSKLLTFGIALAVLAILSTAVGFIELEQAYAQADGGTSTADGGTSTGGGSGQAAAASGGSAAAAAAAGDAAASGAASGK
jgi:hypothetical protein